MIRGHESNMKSRAEITVSEGSALWTRAFHDADARQNEAFRQFHDWFYGLMDPEDERCYADAVVIAVNGLKSEGKS